jgi:hypothetical protein
MLSEKPWRKEFDRLLEEMKARWGGKITNVNDPKDRSLGAVSSSIYVYPTYQTTVDDSVLHVTISEFAFPGNRLIEAADNVEYLSIHLMTPCAFKAAIRHERFMDRFRKKIGLEYEVQTGNEEFDRDYFLITHPKEDINHLKSLQAQEGIMGLEPFSGLSFGSGGINLTRVLHDDSHLNVQSIETTIKKLIALASSTSKQ